MPEDLLCLDSKKAGRKTVAETQQTVRVVYDPAEMNTVFLGEHSSHFGNLCIRVLVKFNVIKSTTQYYERTL